MSDDEPSSEASASGTSAEASMSDRADAPSEVAGLWARERWTRRIVIVTLVAVAVLLPPWIRVVVEGQTELEQASRARAAEDPSREIEHLGRALRWRAPLAGHDEEALERLLAIGGQHQRAGSSGRSMALAAYREVRRGLLATRSWDIPHRDRWEEANVQIADLMAQQERELGTDASEVGSPEAFHRELLARVPGPEPVRGYMAALAFLGWIGAVVGFVLHGLDPRGRLRARPALRWGLMAVVSLVGWTVLLATAHSGP